MLFVVAAVANILSAARCEKERHKQSAKKPEPKKKETTNYECRYVRTCACIYNNTYTHIHTHTYVRMHRKQTYTHACCVYGT